MSADWFCKIGDKKIGPLNGQQLKTVVAKGQLKPEHLVRRGSEGPWVPAGRIKGLFPEGTGGNGRPQGKKLPTIAKPLPRAGAKPGSPPTAKATSLPTAAEAPAPPAAATPQEHSAGGNRQHHAELDVDSLDFEIMPVVSHRRSKSAKQGLKKGERKKSNTLLWCGIGGVLLIGAVAFAWAFTLGPLSSSAKQEAPKDSSAAAQTADSGKKVEVVPAEKKPVEEKVQEDWKKASVDTMLVGDVEVMVLKPTRGAPPEGVKTDETYVLVVPVRLNLKKGATKPVELTSWMDDSLKKKVSLKDDLHKSYDLVGQVSGKGMTITDTWLFVQLVFQAPTSKKASLQLKLPAAAFHGGETMICYTIPAYDIRSDAVKPAEGDSADKTSADKTSADKTGADKTGADKTGADKTGADKTGADKTGADKTGADKTGADKTGADKNSADKPAKFDEGDSTEKPSKSGKNQ